MNKLIALFLFSFLLPNISLTVGLESSQTILNQGTIISSLFVLRWEAHDVMWDQRNNVTKIAENLDMYTAWYSQKGIANDLHQAKSSLKVLVYRNFRAIYSYSDEWNVALANDWILKNSTGGLIYCKRWPENHMADIGNTGYQNFLVDWIKNYTDNWGFDGVFADYGLVVYVPKWAMTGHPINPRTGQDYTDEEWTHDLIAMINKIKNAIPNKLFIANGIFNGKRFYDRQEKYEEFLNQSQIDGFVSEGLFLSGSIEPYYDEATWKKSVDFMIWVQNDFLNTKGKIFGSWANIYYIPNDHTPDQMSGFAFASSLLAANKSDQNHVVCHWNMLSSYTQSLYRIDLGSPIENYHSVSGTSVYEREFSKVLVLVNPTNNNHTVYLNGYYKALSGQIISNITLSDHTGTILLKL